MSGRISSGRDGRRRRRRPSNRARPHDQLRLQQLLPHGRPLTDEDVDQDLGDTVLGLADRGDPEAGLPGHRRVVETGDRHARAHRYAELAGGEDDSQRVLVRRAHDRGRRVVGGQQGARCDQRVGELGSGLHQPARREGGLQPALGARADVPEPPVAGRDQLVGVAEVGQLGVAERRHMVDGEDDALLGVGVDPVPGGGVVLRVAAVRDERDAAFGERGEPGVADGDVGHDEARRHLTVVEVLAGLDLLRPRRDEGQIAAVTLGGRGQVVEELVHVGVGREAVRTDQVADLAGRASRRLRATRLLR